MNKKQSKLVEFIVDQKCIPWTINQLFRKIFVFLGMLLKDPEKYKRFWRQCLDRKYSAAGFILHVYGPDFLKDCEEVCEAVGVKPFLIFGTLLGFVRENGFIPHDYDIDLGLTEEDFGKKHLIMELFLKKGYRQRHNDDYYFSFIHPEHSSLFVDFDRVYKENNKLVIGLLDESDKKTLFCYYFPIEAMDKFRAVTFYNCRIFIPFDPKIFLTVAYGEWQKSKQGHDYIYDYENLFIGDVKHEKSKK